MNGNCQNCGANQWKDGKCVYCGSLHISIDFIFSNPGVALIGTWVDGCCIEGYAWDFDSKLKTEKK